MRVPEDHPARGKRTPTEAAEPWATPKGTHQPTKIGSPNSTPAGDVPPSGSMVDAALWYAANGYPVLPLKPGHKVPLTEHGKNDATKDPEQIRRWWAKWPDANIGAVMSGPTEGVDVDGAKGHASLRELFGGTLPPVIGRVKTPRPDGEHLHIWPVGLPSKGLAPGVDGRGRKGYLLMPPSRLVEDEDQHAGEYTWIEPLDFGRISRASSADSRRWLALTGNPTGEPPRSERTSDPLGPAGVNAALVGEVRRVLTAPEGARNNHLALAACNLGEIVGAGGLDEQMVRGLLAAAALKAGLGESETYKTLEHNIEKGKAKPRPIASDDQAFEQQVQRELSRIRVREEARHRHRLEVAPPPTPFDAGFLGSLLDREPEPEPRIEGVMAWAASNLVAAQNKTGKTVLTLNYCRSLITGKPFLGMLRVRPVTGTVGVLNFELPAYQYGQWADDIGVPHDRLFVVNLRGRRKPFSYPDDREELAALLRSRGVESLIVDPFSGAFGGESENNTTEVRAFLDDLNVFARAEVGATDLLLTTHTGHSTQERARGSSALGDWPDATWYLTKDAEGRRYFRAYGRDIDFREDELTFDSRRRLTLTGKGGKTQAAQGEQVEALVSQLVAAVARTPGISVRGLRDAVPGRNDAIDAARAAALARRLIRVEEHGQARRHYLVEQQETLPQ